jgi:hypothetical protein
MNINTPRDLTNGVLFLYLTIKTKHDEAKKDSTISNSFTMALTPNAEYSPALDNVRGMM